MDLRRLRYFMRVAEARGLSAAAGSLHVAQPALSKAIVSLEQELGAPLLQRSARGVSLTVAGERLYEHGQIILGQIDRARDAVRTAAAKPAGRVAIGMPHSVMMVLGPPFLRHATRDFPDLRIELVQDHSHLLGASLRSGRLDLAVMAAQRSSAGLRSIPLLREDLVFVDRRQPGKAVGRPITFQEASLRPFVLPGLGNGLRAAAEAYFRTRSLRLSVAHEVDGIALITRCVADGLGVSLLPSGCVGCDPTADRLDVRPFAEGDCVRTIVLCKAEDGVKATPAVIEAEKLARGVARDIALSEEWQGVKLIGMTDAPE